MIRQDITILRERPGRARGKDRGPHSATAALMLAAPIFCELSRTGRLGCDVWLVHLTGEEIPSDCLGARQLCRRLVEGTPGRWEKGNSVSFAA